MRFGNTWTTLGNSEIRRLKNVNVPEKREFSVFSKTNCEVVFLFCYSSAIFSAWDFVSLTANPEKPCLQL